MADEKWMKRYEEIKDTLRAIDDIDRYFRENGIEWSRRKFIAFSHPSSQRK